MNRTIALSIVVLLVGRGEGLGQQGLLVVVNRSSHDVTLVDPVAGKVVVRLETGIGPQEVAVSPDGAVAYVANRGIYPVPHEEPIGLEVEKQWVRERDNRVAVVDLRTRRLRTHFDLGRYDRPHGLWVSRDGGLLWVTAEEHNALLELDASSGRILHTWDTPEAAHMVVATPDDRKLYLANTRVFSISIIDRERRTVKTIRTGRSPEGMALSPDGRELWVPNRGDNTISILDVATDTVKATIATYGLFSLQLAFTPDGREVWVSNNNSNTLTVIDAARHTLLDSVALGTQPLGLLIEPSGKYAYVTTPRQNGVAVIDIAERRIVRRIRTGIEPDGLGWASLPATPAGQTPQEVTFGASDGVVLYADLHLAEAGKAAPLLLLFHQGGGNARAEYGPMMPRLVGQGYSVLAVDQRSGGDALGGVNRTVAAMAEAEYSYCDAYLDLEAALGYADREGFAGPIIAWGSSYSASLAIRLGAEHEDDLAGVLAFSPASGGPMGACRPDPYLEGLSLPLLVLRPASEMEIESVQRQFALIERHGHRTYVAEYGTHGSSMLNPVRFEGSAEDNWRAVLAFLAGILDG